MGGAFPLGRIGPIPIFVHWTAALLVFLVFMNANGDMTRFGVVLSNLVIGILLHECGHGLAALLFKARNVTITLWAFGGVCSSTYREGRPAQELIILIAGPAVSFLLAAIGFLAMYILSLSDQSNSVVDFFFYHMFYLNLVLGIFNCIPLFPLDGGQIVFQFQRLIGFSLETAKKISLVLAFVCASGILGWFHLDLIQGEPGARVRWFLVVLVLFLLQSSWSALGPRRPEYE